MVLFLSTKASSVYCHAEGILGCFFSKVWFHKIIQETGALSMSLEDRVRWYKSIFVVILKVSSLFAFGFFHSGHCRLLKFYRILSLEFW